MHTPKFAFALCTMENTIHGSQQYGQNANRYGRGPALPAELHRKLPRPLPEVEARCLQHSSAVIRPAARVVHMLLGFDVEERVAANRGAEGSNIHCFRQIHFFEVPMLTPNPLGRFRPQCPTSWFGSHQ